MTGSYRNWVFSFAQSGFGTTVYAGGNGPFISNGEFLLSTDAGSTWTSLPIDADANPGILSLAVDPEDSSPTA